VRQRHEHLLRPLAPARHVVLHDGDAASKAVLVTKPLENPLGRVRLLLRPPRRVSAPVPRRHRECHHLRNCSGIDPEPPGCRPLAQSLDPDRVPDLRVKLHVLHPPPSADAAQGFQLPDFYSGATDRIGRFTEGFLLRRLHWSCPTRRRLTGQTSTPSSPRTIPASSAQSGGTRPPSRSDLRATRRRRT